MKITPEYHDQLRLAAVLDGIAHAQWYLSLATREVTERHMHLARLIRERDQLEERVRGREQQ